LLIEHQGRRPFVHDTAIVAPTAVLGGDVTVGPRSVVDFGAVVFARGGKVVVGEHTMIEENAVVRASSRHDVVIGDRVLVGPRSVLHGCIVDDECYLATGVTIFHGARIGQRAEVRINGIVHVGTVVPADGLVPIGWIAVGNPAAILPPMEHERIWEIQRTMDFNATVFGVDSNAMAGADEAETADMRAIMRHLTDRAASHRGDRILGDD
jgi:carbonic anhydrase/acetyltransferase-like protein (isoleucine patch superfamily)